MDSLLLATALAYCPVTLAQPYSAAFGEARAAAFAQSGYRAELETLGAGAERSIPPLIRQVAAGGYSVYKQQLLWRGTVLDGSIGTRGGAVLLHFSW